MTDTQTAMTMPADNENTSSAKPAWQRFLPLAIVVGGLGFAYAMGWHRFFTLEFLAQSRDAMTAYVADNYILSIVGFTVLYAVAVAFSFPAASILTIFAGFLFGWFVGGISVAIGATVGATAIFLVARSAFGDFLTEKVGGRVKSLADGFEKEAFSYLLILRLAPVFPFFVMNIAPALFNVPIRTYVIATLVGILPGTFAYTFLGQGVGSVLEAAEAAGTTPSVGDLVTTEITLAFAALAAVATIPMIIKRLRKSPASNTTNQ
ncbi:MAG: TVP38/TMEM64 family protein [Pseudomonadota bacterium]